ncbi:hypothetical protein T484DRAFT_2104015 [Baffinella frigidus]|nr:hypothetical protein T484DRAFT_2104015 [Cryptophyta sp. CCMP2293]
MNLGEVRARKSIGRHMLLSQSGRARLGAKAEARDLKSIRTVSQLPWSAPLAAARHP